MVWTWEGSQVWLWHRRVEWQMQSFTWHHVDTVHWLPLARSPLPVLPLSARNRFTSTEKTGGTFPLRFRCPTTMKSWQLIAVVGDALQVRHMSGGEKGKWARWLEEEFEREIVGCFQCAAVKPSADTFFFSFDSRLSLIATSKVSGDISTAWLVFLHLDARLRFVALRDISQGLERETGAFCMACVLGSGMLSEISWVKEWSISHALSLMVDASTLIPFLKDFVVVKMWFT